MATSQEFIEFVCNQIDEAWLPRYKKMFGEYVVYVHAKPLFLVCDNVVYVRKHDAVKHVLDQAELGRPYHGAKEHYIVDAEDRQVLEAVIEILEPIVPVPVKKRKQSSNSHITAPMSDQCTDFPPAE
jgi:TfoX/Sxy family transcriptional regulator of competence genes